MKRLAAAMSRFASAGSQRSCHALQRRGRGIPDSLDLDVGLIHPPAAPDRAIVFPSHLLDGRQETNRPPVDRRIVDRHTALFHDFLKMPGAQQVGCIPTDANLNHIDRKTYPVEVEHADLS